MEWMLLPLKRYFEFSGRSRRKEYWMFVLFTVIGGVTFGVIDEMFDLKFDDSDTAGDNGLLGSVFSLATLIPSISVAVRRLHDTDRRGLWLLLPLAVVVLGAISVGFTGSFTSGTGPMDSMAIVLVVIFLASFVALIVFFCLDGTSGANRFGEDPKGVKYDGVFD